MKKFNYLLTAITVGAMSMVSCDPVEDINDQLEANEAGISDVFNYTLTEDDYKKVLKLDFTTFNTVEDAKSLVPLVLKNNFPVLGDGSTAFVGYNRFLRASTEDSIVLYKVTNDDYANYPATQQYSNFSNNQDVIPFLEKKYPNAVNRMLVSLEYKLYNGRFPVDVKNGFLYNGGSWSFINGFSEDEYKTAGEVRANFSSEDEAEFKIPGLLKRRYEFELEPMVNTIMQTMYNLYVVDESDLDGDGNKTERIDYSYVKNFVYDGEDWVVYNNVLSETLQFGNDAGEWIPDNTIAYTLAVADYAFIGSELSSEFPAQTASMLRYNNLDRRSGNDAYWSDDLIYRALNLLLNKLDANAEEGQKYAVTLDIYNGSNTTETFFVIKTNGSWVKQ